FVKQHADILIAPLCDNQFNRCKSALKFLEYGWLGAPGVYSRIVTYERVVEDGVNGLLANGPEEWEAALVRLIEDPALRARLGTAARATVDACWRLSRHAHEWPETYRKARHATATTVQNASRRVAGQLAASYRDAEKSLGTVQERARSSEATVDSLRQ